MPTRYLGAVGNGNAGLKPTGPTTITAPASGTLTVAPGDLLVVEAGGQSTNTTTKTVPSSIASTPSLTWTSQAAISSGTSICPATLWTASVPAGTTTVTVTVTYSLGTSTGGLAGAVTLHRLSAAALAATPTVVAVAVSSGQTTTITPTKRGSLIVWSGYDFNAVTGARTYLGGGVEVYYYAPTTSGQITAYSAYQPVPTLAAQTLGQSAPTGQKPTIIGIECVPTYDAPPPLTGFF